MEKLKVLLHIDELAKWHLTLANAQNLLDDVGENQVQLEIVINAIAVKIFDAKATTDGDAKEHLINRMMLLSNRGADFVVCRNALRANSVNEEGLPPFVTVVPAGITRIVTRQAEGYSYVKP